MIHSLCTIKSRVKELMRLMTFPFHAYGKENPDGLSAATVAESFPFIIAMALSF